METNWEGPERPDFSQGPHEDTPALLAGYRRAVSYALEALSDASEHAIQGMHSLEILECIRTALQSLEEVDQHPSHAAAALIAMEQGVKLAPVLLLQKIDFAVKRVRDLMAWRAQLCAPVGNRCLFIQACREAWSALGRTLHDSNLAIILHAHRQEVSRQILGSFDSETQRQSRARGGKIRPARNRLEDH